MPRTETRPIVEPAIQHSPVTTPDAARDALRQFAHDNGHNDKVFEEGLSMFAGVVAEMPHPVVVWEHWQSDLEEAHNFFEDMVNNPVAHNLAVIAVDALPATRVTSAPLPDACGAVAKAS